MERLSSADSHVEELPIPLAQSSSIHPGETQWIHCGVSSHLMKRSLVAPPIFHWGSNVTYLPPTPFQSLQIHKKGLKLRRRGSTQAKVNCLVSYYNADFRAGGVSGLLSEQWACLFISLIKLLGKVASHPFWFFEKITQFIHCLGDP